MIQVDRVQVATAISGNDQFPWRPEGQRGLQIVAEGGRGWRKMAEGSRGLQKVAKDRGGS